MDNEYIGNAKVVKFSELPHIGDRHEHKFLHDRICIEVKIVKFENGYAFYEAWFCKEDSIAILDDFYTDCGCFSYAVKL